jgi:dephospho-CoA kinase
MLKVGLTGNIGSGKSLVAKIFSILGIPVYNSDNESKKFLESEEVKTTIIKNFGSEILFADGAIDRRKLGNIVFSDPSSLNTLNSILHPLVIKDFTQWCLSNRDQKYIIQETAILFESGYYRQFDKTIQVICSPEIAIERVIQRDKSTREEVLKRMQFQFEDSKKAAIADYVILNDGSELIIPQIQAIHKKLLQISA